MEVVLVRGIGDVGSAVAHTLFFAGYAVIIHDSPQPTASRRSMAFTDAIFDGVAQLEGVQAVLVEDLQDLPRMVAARQLVPVVVADLSLVLRAVALQVLVDARMRKHEQPEVQLGLAPLTIGLGPNFTAGVTTDLAVETAWGDEMGKVLSSGTTRPLEGDPKPIGGHARDRYVYAPTSGVFRTSLQVGDPVQAGQIVALVDSASISAPLTGVLRGLTRDGVWVTSGAKVLEVDPRDEPVLIGIGERPASIAAGVLDAIQAWGKMITTRGVGRIGLP